ncbi:hypothetical protein C3486_02795 [Streptomyces sp. Ru73]|uniref:hypothetical protein n=1 Tax=Streptomyces sp. Ru73 TaxID=2080748 RepID=UPI000CDDEA81|nr:hypothetical protein [Streptomyces sp. Ru73]POX42831.1 hypothetical protein C3486_02795 [Streptomyces sp. Ru73]
MIIELAVERVQFTCGHCWHEWSTDYDVQQYKDAENGEWEYFSRDGVAVASPYTPAGAPPCPQCGRRWVGRIIARRPIPPPPGPAGTPRQRIAGTAGHRPERHGAPLLGADAHAQPGKLPPPDGGPHTPDSASAEPARTGW